MGFSIGGGSSKSKSKSQSHSVLTPTNPAWVEPQVQGFADKATSLLGQNPQNFVAGADPLQTQAAQEAGNIQPNMGAYGSAQGLFQTLMNTSTPQPTAVTGQASSLLPNLPAYMSPYTQQVVDTSLADYDVNANRQRAQNQLSTANLDDTFGGSNRYISSGILEGELGRGRGALDAGIRDQGFQVGAGLANQDADRRQGMSLANMTAQNNMSQFNAGQLETALARQAQAGRDLVSTAGQAQDAQTSAATTKMDLGAILQQIAQAQAGAPISVLGSLGQTLSGLPFGLFNGKIEDSKGKTSGTSMSVNAGWKA